MTKPTIQVSKTFKMKDQPSVSRGKFLTNPTNTKTQIKLISQFKTINKSKCKGSMQYTNTKSLTIHGKHKPSRSIKFEQKNGKIEQPTKIPTNPTCSNQKTMNTKEKCQQTHHFPHFCD